MNSHPRGAFPAAFTPAQRVATTRAVRSLVTRGLVVSGFADWETYADQVRGLRTKVWLPTQQPPRTLRRVLRAHQVREVILAVLTPPLPPREWLTDQERPWRTVFHADVWLPYSIFTTHVYQRLGQLVGERPVHRGRLNRRFYQHLHCLEQEGLVRVARQNGQRLYIRRWIRVTEA